MPDTPPLTLRGTIIPQAENLATINGVVIDGTINVTVQEVIEGGGGGGDAARFAVGVRLRAEQMGGSADFITGSTFVGPPVTALDPSIQPAAVWIENTSNGRDGIYRDIGDAGGGMRTYEFVKNPGAGDLVSVTVDLVTDVPIFDEGGVVGWRLWQVTHVGLGLVAPLQSVEIIRGGPLATLGAQTTVADATALNAANGALLLDSDLELLLAEGDVVEFRAFIAFTNSSGDTRNYYPALLLGSTNIVSSQDLSIPEATTVLQVEGSISVISTTSQIVAASLGSQSDASNSIGRVIVQTSEDVSSAKAFNLGIRSNVSTDTQSAQILFFNAWRRRQW